VASDLAVFAPALEMQWGADAVRCTNHGLSATGRPPGATPPTESRRLPCGLHGDREYPPCGLRDRSIGHLRDLGRSLGLSRSFGRRTEHTTVPARPTGAQRELQPYVCGTAPSALRERGRAATTRLERLERLERLYWRAPHERLLDMWLHEQKTDSGHRP